MDCSVSVFNPPARPQWDNPIVLLFFPFEVTAFSEPSLVRARMPKLVNFDYALITHDAFSEKL